jgi:AcrR family transcriptional regulator
VGSKERRERERVETRQRILDAARELFVQQGYEATTMRAIADRIEFTPTAIYHHFESKEVLLTELCRVDMRALVRAFERIGRIEDPIERIERIGAAYVAFALEHPMQYRFMFMSVRPELPDPLRAARDDPAENAYVCLRRACAEGIAAGRFRPEYVDPDELAQILCSSMHGIVSMRLMRGDDGLVEFRDPRATAARMRTALLRGLLRD